MISRHVWDIYRLELLFVIGLPYGKLPRNVIGLPYGKLPRNAWAQPILLRPNDLHGLAF